MYLLMLIYKSCNVKNALIYVEFNINLDIEYML